MLWSILSHNLFLVLPRQFFHLHHQRKRISTLVIGLGVSCLVPHVQLQSLQSWNLSVGQEQKCLHTAPFLLSKSKSSSNNESPHTHTTDCNDSNCPEESSSPSKANIDWKKLTKAEWAERLTPEAYHSTREGGTEPAFSGRYYNNKAEGIYRCVCCGTELFTSKAKFDSGSGWPSFFAPIDSDRITVRKDVSHGMVRTEILCATCDAHLGHVFDDGPKPTGQRYCVNSVALKFIPKKLN